MILSVVPQRKVRDPRQLLYHYPSMPAIRYAQLMQEYHHDSLLRLAEDMAKGLGYLLVPSCCLHWRKKQEVALERQVNVGKNTYYMLKQEEIPPRSYKKFREYVEELQDEAI